MPRNSRCILCPPSLSHLTATLNYVEQNPCRAGLVERPEDYRWSSAAVHLKGVADAVQVLDTRFFERAGEVDAWRERAAVPIPADDLEALRKCTFGNRPYGEDEFAAALEKLFGRACLRMKPETRPETELGQSRSVTAGEYLP